MERDTRSQRSDYENRRRSSSAPRTRTSRNGSSSQNRRSSRQGSRRSDSVPQFEEGDRARSSRRSRSSRGQDTGYRVSHHPIRFNDSYAPRGFLSRFDSRGLVILAIAILLVFLLIFGMVSCVQSCSSQKVDDGETQVNAIDSRVAYGTDEDLTSELSTVLDQSEDLQWIAKHADEYSDARIVELAIREPAAISFVRNQLDAEKKAESYDDEVTQGTYPLLYDWDSRWGYVEYGGDGLPLGLTGSGPTCLSMAYMGLTGKADMTPADMADLAAEYGYDTGDAFCTSDLFTAQAENLGLSCVQTGLTSDELTTALASGVVVAQVNADTLTSEAHWVLVVTTNDDGSVTVYDPTSTDVSSHTWDPGTIAASSSGFWCLSAASTDTTSA
jgi:hypothetical protein